MIRDVFGEELELSTFAPEIMPVMILEADRPEWKLQKDEFLWTTGRIPIGAGGVGNFSRVQVLNPTTSVRIVVVTHVKARGIVAANHPVTVDAALAATPTGNIAMDTRVPVAPVGNPTVASQNLIANNNAVVSGYVIDEVPGVAQVGVLIQLPNPEILLPGHNITVFDGTGNEAFVAYFWGYERKARPEELIQ